MKLHESWFSVSNLGFDHHQIQLVCNYFGYKGGYEYTYDLLQDKAFVLFSISCKNASSFSDCIIENFGEVWLNRFYVPYLNINCFNKKISKKKKILFYVIIFSFIIF